VLEFFSSIRVLEYSTGLYSSLNTVFAVAFLLDMCFNNACILLRVDSGLHQFGYFYSVCKE